MNAKNVTGAALLGMVLLLGGCISNDMSLVIIQNAVVDDTDCGSYAGKEDFWGSGMLDTAFPWEDDVLVYVMQPRLYNFLESTIGGSSGSGEGANILLQSAEVTYSWSKTPPDPQLITLEGLDPLIIPMSGIVDAAKESGKPGEVVYPIRVLPPDYGRVLRTLDSYPEAMSNLALYVHLSVHGKTTGGYSVTSNEFVYPIFFCSGCLAISQTTTGTPVYTCCSDTPSTTDDYFPEVCRPGQDERVDTKVCECGTVTP